MTALIVVQQGGIVAGVVTAAKVQAGAQVGNLWLRGARSTSVTTT